MSRQQYQLSTGVWVIAECTRCGRGFVYLGTDSNMRDPFLPQTGSHVAFGHVPCGGEITMLLPPMLCDLREFGL